MRIVHPSPARRHRAAARHTVRVVVLVCVTGGLWWGASVPWGMSVWHIVPFIAPGALLALGAGWMAHAATRWRWTWRAAARWAAVGAFGLSPLLVVFVGVEGNLHPERLLSGFVRAAWAAFAAGAVWAAVRYARVRRAHRAALTASSKTTSRTTRASA